MLKAIIKNNKIDQIVSEDLLRYITAYEVIDFPFEFIESTQVSNFYIDSDRNIQRIKSKEEYQKEQYIFQLKSIRNQRLANTDWTQIPDNNLTAECKEEFRIYRQALRDIDFNNLVWPEIPKERRNP